MDRHNSESIDEWTELHLKLHEIHQRCQSSIRRSLDETIKRVSQHGDQHREEIFIVGGSTTSNHIPFPQEKIIFGKISRSGKDQSFSSSLKGRDVVVVEHHRLKSVKAGVERVVLGFDLCCKDVMERAELINLFSQRAFLEPCFHHSAEERVTSDTNETVKVSMDDKSRL
ncbi:Uncharacterized protein Rs2_21591 [Raphanus sativus]|nr:Uncharacterized protein Rs2_21591 [Raphanus sativus]